MFKSGKKQSALRHQEMESKFYMSNTVNFLPRYFSDIPWKMVRV